MSPVGIEPKISAGEKTQTYALDRAGTGIGKVHIEANVTMNYVYGARLSVEVLVKLFPNMTGDILTR
jgi:hypothetical protein